MQYIRHIYYFIFFTGPIKYSKNCCVPCNILCYMLYKGNTFIIYSTVYSIIYYVLKLYRIYIILYIRNFCEMEELNFNHKLIFFKTLFNNICYIHLIFNLLNYI